MKEISSQNTRMIPVQGSCSGVTLSADNILYGIKYPCWRISFDKGFFWYGALQVQLDWTNENSTVDRGLSRMNIRMDYIYPFFETRWDVPMMVDQYLNRNKRKNFFDPILNNFGAGKALARSNSPGWNWRSPIYLQLRGKNKIAYDFQLEHFAIVEVMSARTSWWRFKSGTDEFILPPFVYHPEHGKGCRVILSSLRGSGVQYVK